MKRVLSFLLTFILLSQTTYAAVKPSTLEQNALNLDSTFHVYGSGPCEISDASVIGSAQYTIPTEWGVRGKLAQLLMVSVSQATDVQPLIDSHIGGAFLQGRQFNSADASWISQLNNAPIPFIVGADEEGGKVQRIRDIGSMSSAKEMGSMADNAVTGLAKKQGELLRSIGVNMAFSPVADLEGTSSVIAGNQRAYSSDPNVVTAKANAFASGLRQSGVAPTFKHFPGHGNANGDSHVSVVTTPDLATLKARDLKPYETILKAGDAAVMMGHLMVPGLSTQNLPASLDPAAYNLLRTSYGFNGLTITDDIGGMLAIKSKYGVEQAASLAIQAGADMVLFVNENKVTSVLNTLESDYNAGKISDSRLNEALLRIGKFRQSFNIGKDSSTSGAACGSNLSGLALNESDIIKHVVFSGKAITPTSVVLHWTGGSPDASVETFVSSIKSNDSCGVQGCSVQIYIDGSGRVYQLVDQLNTATEHASNFNSSSIGIEIAAGSDGTVKTAEKEINSNEVQKKAVVATVAYLMQKFNMQLEPNLSTKRGLLSHHIVDPGRKQDVGDTYYQTILSTLRSAGGGGSFTPGDPNALPPKVRAVNFDLNPNVKIGQTLAVEYGWGNGNEFQCLFELYTRESTWRTNADNPSSSAYGIPQALPGSKMASEGADWMTNPTTQIKWGLKYIKGRYKTPCNAIVWHNAHNWY